MRGMLQIRSARTPYLRAGLSFALREPVRVDIRDLDGARLLELARDPVLSIAMGDDDGTFRQMPAFDESVGVEQAQMMIDSLATELPPRVEAIGDPVGAELDAIVAKFREAGLDSVDDALKRITAMDDLLAAHNLGSDDQLGLALAKSAAAMATLKEAGFETVAEALSTLTSVRADLKDANGERDDLAKKVTALEAEIVELKAKPAADAKPAKPKATPAAK